MSTLLLPPQSLVVDQARCWHLRVGGYAFELLVSENYGTFNEQSHAVNYAGYLFRQGRERPNDLTSMNRVRWLGYEGSADGRDANARKVMVTTASHLVRSWEEWVTEIIFFLPLRPQDATTRLPLSAYRLIWDALAEVCTDIELDASLDLWASHVDQSLPPHVHRVHDRSRLRFYELIGEAVRTGRIESLAGPMAGFIAKAEPPH